MLSNFDCFILPRCERPLLAGNPWRSEFAYVCLSFELVFESKLVVFIIKLNVHNLRNRNILTLIITLLQELW